YKLSNNSEYKCEIKRRNKMSHLFENLEKALKESRERVIVFPEAMDERIMTAASKLSEKGIMTPLLIGKQEDLMKRSEELKVNIEKCKVVDPLNYKKFDDMVDEFVKIRKGKATKEQAKEILRTENYFGTMLVYMDEAHGLVSGAFHSTSDNVRPALQIIKSKAKKEQAKEIVITENNFGKMLVYMDEAHGLVSGAVHSTSDTVRPALQIIKTLPGINKTSGVFIMVRGEERYVFGDCAINIAPTSDDLAEIAVESSKTAKVFGIDPKVAMLSFSTKGSAQSEETERAVDAIAKAKEMNPKLMIDGEFQFDAAFVPSVAAKKA